MMSWNVDVLGRAKGRVPGILAVGTLILMLAGKDLALDDNLRLRGYLDINCLALDELDWLAKESACNLEFIDLHRHLGGCRDVDRRMNAYNDRDFQITAARFAALQMFPDMPPRMQACPELVRALELKPLITEVTRPGIGVLAHKNAGSDVATGILLEVTTDRQRSGINLRPDPHDLLDRPVINDPGRQQVGEGLDPGLIESARLDPGHTSDPVAAGEQVRHDRCIESDRPVNQDDRRLAAVFEFEDHGSGNIVDVDWFGNPNDILRSQRRHVVPKRLCFLAWRARSPVRHQQSFLGAGETPSFPHKRNRGPLTITELTMPT
jgi:hypothetical protein